MSVLEGGKTPISSNADLQGPDRALRPTREELAAWSAELEGQSAEDILRWAADRFAPRLTFATGFGMEGCIIIDMATRQSLPVDFFTLDTGLLFQESYELWRRLEARYGTTIRSVGTEYSVDEQARREGPELWGRDPDRCCELRKVQPLRATLAAFDAWISAVRRDQTPDRADTPVVGWDGKFGLVKVNPLVRWTFEDVRAYVTRHDVPYNALHDQGYPEHWLLALHDAGRSRRRCARGQMAWAREDRMWAAYPTTFPVLNLLTTMDTRRAFVARFVEVP